MELYPHQKILAQEWCEILKKYNIILYWAQMRTWKTAMALQTAKLYEAKSVLFISKKKALSSIEKDYKEFWFDFNIKIINYESIHKIEWTFDILILDETHWSLSKYPKPSQTHKDIKKRFWNLPMILLSWTPFIESASKAFHTFNVSSFSPFRQYKNFYEWHHIYWIPKIIYTSYWTANSYDDCHYDRIYNDIKHLMLTLTQSDAWFTTTITEHEVEVKMKPSTYSLINKLIEDRVVQWKTNTIVADTWVKLQSSCHQLFAWTIKLDSWEAIVTDDSIAKEIHKRFKGHKIAIMTVFIKELELIQSIFWDTITTNLEEFNNTDKSYVWNIVSNREWVNLSKADALVFYNIPFSWTSFVQWRERLASKDRTENHVYFFYAEWWLQKQILEVVREKKNYSNKIFENKFLKYYI